MGLMNCPPDVAEVLLEILKHGLLRIRQAGAAGESRCCAVEADHLHDLPELLNAYSPELLRHYWEVQRPSYMSQAEASFSLFGALWERLARSSAVSFQELSPQFTKILNEGDDRSRRCPIVP